MLSVARPEPDELVPVAEGVSLAVWRWGPPPAEAGDAAPFVLVHGLASNAHLWDGVARRLADAGHPVVSLDLRGHGRSSKPDGPYDVPSVAADVAALVRALGLTGDGRGPVVLAGQSYGAIVVLEVARSLGDGVAAVCCVDGGHLDARSRWATWGQAEQALAPPRIAGTPAAEIERWMLDSHADWPREGVAGALACFEERADGTVAPWLTYERHLQVARGLWEHDTVALRRATTHHVVLLTASEGPGGKADDVERAAAQLADVEVVSMTGHHDLHAQHPAAVAELLRGLAPRREGARRGAGGVR